MYGINSVKLIQKAALPDGRFMVWVQYDEINGNNTKTHTDTRTCKPTKKGIVSVSLFGDKYKFDLNSVKVW